MVAAGHRGDTPAAFAQRGRWRRFQDPSTEASYRAWHRDQILPVARAIGIGAALLWAVVPVVYEVMVGESSSLLRVSNWLVAMPVLLTLVVGSYTPLVRWATWSIAVGIVVLGLDFVWVMSAMFSSSSGAVACGVLAVIFFPLIIRLPTGAATFVVSVLTAVPVALLIRGALQHEVPLREGWVYGAILLFSAPVLVVAAALIEATMREQFAASTQLEMSQRLIRRYVPSAVAARIESGDAGAIGVPQRMRVTALSSDVAGFTVLADRLDPESLSQIISEYVAVMSDVVERQGGVVTEFAGDGLMAIFGAPEQREPGDQVRQALAAAEGMHQRLAELSQTWFHLGIEQPLQVRIGINTGVLSVGTFGSDGRGTYTAIGLQMNIAARIQSECVPGTTFLSSSSWHLVKDEVPCEPLGEVTVKGVHFPISVYAPR